MPSTMRVARPATARRRVPARLIGAGAGAVLLLVVGVAVPANADPSPPPTVASPPVPPSPDDPIARVALAEANLNTTAFDLLGAQAELVRLQGLQRGAELQRDIADLATIQRAAEVRAGEALLARRNDAVAAQLRALRRLAQEAFVAGNDTSLGQIQALLSGDTTDQQGRIVAMSDEVVRHEGAELRTRQRAQRAAGDALDGARLRLVSAQAALTTAQQAADQAAAATQQQATVRADAQGRHDAALAERANAIAQLRASANGAVGTAPLNIPILGDPRLAAEDLAGWFATSPYRPRIPTPIADFAKWFIDEGRQEGVRGDIAFAQAVLETGGFSNNDSVVANNYSGIGHCDTCAGGFVFPSPQLGVRAQIQLLKSYAVANPTYANPLVDPRLRGPAGCCPTWGDLTRVRATAPTYGPIVMGIYSQIVAFALRRHALTVGP